MSKIKEFFKKFYTNFKKWVSKNRNLAIFILAISPLVVGYIYINLKEESPAKKAGYTELKADNLFALNSDKLKEVKNFYVINPQSYGNRDILIRKSKDNKIYIYKDVSIEAFSVYTKTVLEDSLKANNGMDFRYLPSYEDVNKRLGLKEQLAITEPKVEKESKLFSHLISLLMVVFLAYLIWSIGSGKGLTTKISMVQPKDINDDLNDLVGLEDIKQELLQLEDMYKHRNTYQQFNVAKNFNIMMTGAAGLGKTKIARCLAKRLDVPMFYSSAAGLQSGYVGGGSRALKNLVKEASKFKRVIIFIDEAETLLMSRTGRMEQYQVETINTFLSLLDGVNTTKSEIIWIVASNADEHKISMDEATMRRFHLKTNFRMPNFDERKAVIEKFLGEINSDKIADDVDSHSLAGISSGISPANLKNMIDRAGLIAIQENSLITQEILLKAFERVNVGLTDRATTDKLPEQRLLVARHEVGHFLVKLSSALEKAHGDLSEVKQHIDVIKISTEAVSKMNALGFVLSKEREVKLESLNEYETIICELYGGMANEELYYGKAGVTGGAHNDIAKVSQLLKVMITEVGFYQDSKLNYAVLNGSEAITSEQLELIKKHSGLLYTKTKTTLEKYRDLSDILVEALMNKYQLDIEEALVYIRDYFETNPPSVFQQPAIAS